MGAPLAAVASPIIGAVIGAGIGAVVGAGIGASYASAPARVDADAPAKASSSPVSELVAALPAPAAPVVDAAYSDPTVKNIGRALDRAAETNPGSDGHWTSPSQSCR
ncbi:hypothetical protein GOARA_051_00260 [Gordonia araii NBRC 100433]|uniref:Uncharacterized protein n=1 Tax=Gordonia araii NBRC 100433 TaxID=1073574 RepID=G7H2K7_9ACTN|nr:hypothetical protein [Gordonia araii]NNG97738.1 hypothetical protein [Gordonia araii NBRC 100433]GAB10082.1 hypothetical protein GOARA_051_00260 [Gordonia araii NBRC 100433]